MSGCSVLPQPVIGYYMRFSAVLLTVCEHVGVSVSHVESANKHTECVSFLVNGSKYRYGDNIKP